VAHGNPALLEKRLGVGLQIQKPHGIGTEARLLPTRLEISSWVRPKSRWSRA
jgi:hypothetical protein